MITPIREPSHDVTSSSAGGCHVILVHGTWGHGIWHSILWDILPQNRRQKQIQWPLRKKLEVAGAVTHSFTWSGRNSHRGRVLAGKDLAALVDRLGTKDVCIVAHSHGGNVALYALKDVGHKLNRIVFLATPFLHFDQHEFDFRLFRWLPIVVGYGTFPIAFSTAVSLYYIQLEHELEQMDPFARELTRMASWLGPPLEHIGLMFLAAGVAATVAWLAARRLGSRFATTLNRLSEICDSYQPPTPQKHRCLILRKVGDEASAALSTGRLIEFLLMLGWRRLSRFLRTLPVMSSIFKWPRQYWWMAVVLYVATIPLFSWLTDTDAISVVLDGALYVSAALVAVVLLLCALHLLLLVFLLGLNVLRYGFGQDMVATSLVRVITEPTPRGSWEVSLYPGKELAHSEIHQDHEIAHIVVNWLLSR